MKKDNVDWTKLWVYLSVDVTKPGYCDAQGWVTESEIKALEKFGKFIAKMNPPEDDRIPLEARKENDVRFRAFVESQFPKHPDLKNRTERKFKKDRAP